MAGRRKRTTDLRRIEVDKYGVDHLCIGDWFQLESMAINRGSFEFDLHIGDAQFSVTVPKDASKAVEVKRVE